MQAHQTLQTPQHAESIRVTKRSILSELTIDGQCIATDTSDLATYFIDKQYLNSGACGSVHLAHVTDACRRLLPGISDVVVIKTFLLSTRGNDPESLLNEIRLLKSLDAPFVPKYYGCFFTKGAKAGASSIHDIHIVMEHIDGWPLVTYEHKFTPEEKLDITKQVAAAIAHLHQLGIVHRDIRPDNVMVRKDGRIALVDFGFSCDTNALMGWDGCNHSVVTEGYTHPAIKHGDFPSMKRSDWHAYAYTIIALYAGVDPFMMGPGYVFDPSRFIERGLMSVQLTEILQELIDVTREPKIAGILRKINGL